MAPTTTYDVHPIRGAGSDLDRHIDEMDLAAFADRVAAFADRVAGIDHRAQREAAIAAEIQRLREYAESGVYLPLDIRYEHIDLDDGLSLVTAGGNDSPPLHTVARVMWYPERELEGDLEVGAPYPVIEDLQVWATVDGPDLPMRDITALLGQSALAEISGICKERLAWRLRDREEA